MKTLVKAPTSVCDFCYRTVLTSQQSWGRHHGSLASLEASVKECCVFCTNLLQEARTHFPNLAEEKALQWPLYRWTIHSCAGTRDMINARSIVFRPLNSSLTGHDEDIADLLGDQIFYLYNQQDLGPIPDPTTLGASTDSPQSWAQIRDWIEICRQSHSQCQLKQNTSAPLPTRLLDVSKIDPDADDSQLGHMKLVITKDQNIKGPYTTLSHSWGKGRTFIKVNADNKDIMIETGMKLGDERLTNNFREAIRATRKLGINYIWMDSICIWQGDKSDFAIEAPRMHIYYRHSYCNIAAADSKEPDQGLFRSRISTKGLYPTIPASFQSSHENKIFGEQSWYIIAGDLWKTELLTEPLYRRGWVFQERMLAPRIIHYAKDQIFFECAEMTACETLPGGFMRGVDARAATDRYWRQRLHHNLLAKDRPLHGTAEISIEELWKTSISTYTRCELTNGSDKLVAISGVAALVGDILGEDYGDGIWDDKVEEQLAWRVVDLSQANGSPSQRPKTPRCSSWTWASIDAIIELRDRLVEREYCVTNHQGGPLKFEIIAHEMEVAVPHMLGTDPDIKGASPLTGPPSIIPTTPTATTNATADQSLQVIKLKLPSIKISAYVRRGQLHANPKSKTWALQVSEDAQNSQIENIESVRAFLDEPQKANTMTCHFIVLAYSRNTPPPADYSEIVEEIIDLDDDDHEPTETPQVSSSRQDSPDLQKEIPPTFSGIGLVIEEIIPNHFSRLGSFTFDDLFEESLARLVVVKDETKSAELPLNIFLH